MVTREQFVNGVLSYVDREIMPSLPTAGKWGVGAIVMIARQKSDTLLNEVVNNPVVKAMGVVSDDGLIDCELLMDSLKVSAERYGCLQLDFPLMGILTFNHNDIDKMKSCIMSEVYENDRSSVY